MSAPKHAYPIGKPTRDSGNKDEIANLETLPVFECDCCGYVGGGKELLGVDDESTMWCPICRTSGWVWQ